MIGSLKGFGKLGLARLARKRLGWLAAGLALAVLSLAAGIALLALSGWFITASALAGLGLIVALDIFTPGAGIRLAALTRTVSRYLERLITHEATFRLLADLRIEVFSRLLRHDEIQLRSLRRGDTLSRLTADVDLLDHLFLGIAAPTLAAVIVTLLASLLLALVNPVLALIPILCLIVAGPVVTGMILATGRQSSRQLGQALPELRGLASDSIEGLGELRALNQLGMQGKRINQIALTITEFQRRLATLDALGQAVVIGLGFLAAWLTLVASLLLVQRGLITAPVAGLIVLAVFGLGEAWHPLPAAWRRLSLCRTAAERTVEVINQPSGLPAPTHSVMPGPGFALFFEHVYHAYCPFDPPVFKDFSLKIAHGEKIAVTGPSGSGKTTLALLLMRQIDPQSGRVVAGAIDLKQIDPDQWRQLVGYLPQNPVLFRDSLAANLRLARPLASDEEMTAALNAVGLGPFLDGLPEGLDSWIDEAGANVSGGQRRRIALARLMLTDPPIVILDEPLAGLDPVTRRELAVRLSLWLADKTAIMITHSLDELPHHDRVIRLG